MVAPNYARITSLSSWAHFFHPTTGVFRLPSSAGNTIEHLDIDLRYVQHNDYSRLGSDATARDEVHLPRVVKLTLRGGEFVQECEQRMECLSEVLAAISPVEVCWLNAFDHPDEQQTLSTVLVHPVIITAGELWESRGTLRKLVIQGGFPVPNLTAPTPYAVTPAVTPATSPGPTHRTFAGTPGFPSGLPSLSLTKPKPISEAKIRERAERYRIAEFELKPRWEFAFATWGVQEIRWKFDGRYSSAAIKTVMSRLIEGFNKSFPSTCTRAHYDLPALLTFSPIPADLVPTIQALPMDAGLGEYLTDTVFISTDNSRFARVFSHSHRIDQHDPGRMTQQLKAEMILFQTQQIEIIDLDQLVTPSGSAHGSTLSVQDVSAELGQVSPAISCQSMLVGDTDTGSDDGDEAQTPPMGRSMHVDRGLGLDVDGKMGKGPMATAAAAAVPGQGQVQVARRLLGDVDAF